MLKRVFKETGYSMKRNPVKVVLIGLIMFISSNLLFSSLLISKGISNDIKEAEEYLNQEVRLAYIDPTIEEFNFQRFSDSPVIYEDMQLNVDNYYGNSYGQTVLLDTLKSTAYQANIHTLGLFPGFNAEVNTNISKPYHPFILNIFDYYQYLPYMNYRDSTKEIPYEIIEGENVRHFEGESQESYDEYESHNKEIVISDVSAKENNLTIGDSLTLDMGVEKFEVSIIGIYKAKDENLNKRTILTNFPTFSRVRNEGNIDYGASVITDLRYWYESAADALRFIERENPNIEYQNLKWETRVGDYETIIGEFQNLNTKLYTFDGIVIVLTTILLALVLNKDIKKNEVIVNSIYHDDKKRLKVSTLLEVFIITSVALLLTLYTAPALSDIVGQKIVFDHVTLEEIRINNTEVAENKLENLQDPESFYSGTLGPEQHEILYYDHYMVASLNVGFNILSAGILILMIYLAMLISVALGTRQLKHKKEAIE